MAIDILDLSSLTSPDESVVEAGRFVERIAATNVMLEFTLDA